MCDDVHQSESCHLCRQSLFAAGGADDAHRNPASVPHLDRPVLDATEKQGHKFLLPVDIFHKIKSSVDKYQINKDIFQLRLEGNVICSGHKF